MVFEDWIDKSEFADPFYKIVTVQYLHSYEQKCI